MKKDQKQLQSLQTNNNPYSNSNFPMESSVRLAQSIQYQMSEANMCRSSMDSINNVSQGNNQIVKNNQQNSYQKQKINQISQIQKEKLKLKIDLYNKVKQQSINKNQQKREIKLQNKNKSTKGLLQSWISKLSYNQAKQDVPNQNDKKQKIINDKVQQKLCKICLNTFQQKQIIQFCPNKHTFCQNCLENYVKFKLQKCQALICPEQKCNLLIDTSSEFYQSLSSKQTIDTNIKLNPEICTHNLPDKKIVQFLQDKLKYKQCQNCKHVVQKIEGCNHIVCRCKFQFCYLCGKTWQQKGHSCKKIQSKQKTQQIPANAVSIIQQDSFNQCFAESCQQYCGKTYAFVAKISIRIFLSVVLFFYMILVFMSVLLMAILLIMASICVGIFFQSVSFICQLFSDSKTIIAVMSIIILPVPMCVGIYRAFKIIFKEFFLQYLKVVKDKMNNWKWIWC